MAVVGIATAETLGVQENWSTVAVDGNLFPLQSLIAIQFPVMGFLELKRYQVRPRRALDASRAVPRVATLFPSSRARARERCESAPQPANARVAWGPAPCVRACVRAGRPAVRATPLLRGGARRSTARAQRTVPMADSRRSRARLQGWAATGQSGIIDAFPYDPWNLDCEDMRWREVKVRSGWRARPYGAPAPRQRLRSRGRPRTTRVLTGARRVAAPSPLPLAPAPTRVRAARRTGALRCSPCSASSDRPACTAPARWRT